MNIQRALRLAFFALILLLLFLPLSPAEAQNKSVTVIRRDCDVTIQVNGDVHITETWEVQFEGGPFTFAFRGIALNKVEAIDGFTVWEDGQAYQASSAQTAYTFTTYREKGQQFVKWFFPPTTDQTRTFVLEYTLHGALRIYKGGDQFWWKIIERDRGYVIERSTITVHLPATFSTDQLKAAVTSGHGTVTIQDGTTIVFTSTSLSGYEELEIRVQFPHGVVTASAPRWQLLADVEAVVKPLLNLGFLVNGIFLLLGGLLGLYLLWYLQGRDPPVLMTPKMSTPPSDLLPAMVGTLIDERADMKEIIASIVDLARRGIIKITEKQTEVLNSIRRDFIFDLVGDTEGLRKYEKTLVKRIFARRTQRRLSSLKRRFYTAIPTLQEQMYEEVTNAGYFPKNPETVRREYERWGVAGLILFGGISFCLFGALPDYAQFAICLPSSLTVISIGLIVVSRFMPKRTLKGAIECQKWLAFKRYLESIEKFTKLDQAEELFEKYLPYAIAFGLEKSWVQKFAAVGTPAPVWYEIYPSRPLEHMRGYAEGDGVKMGDIRKIAGPSMPSLDEMASSAFRGLDSMSEGLFSMLDSAVSVLRSTPPISIDWSSGGIGGWSGGGGGGGDGGGGGGGGSSGFG